MIANEVVIRTCPVCEQNTMIAIPVDAYDKWTTGMTIQKAWPNSSVIDREVLISGICPKCQKEIFYEL